MSDIRDWDRDEVNNQDPSPDGFREGMAPAEVNNSSREVMAAVRRQQEVAQWFDWGHDVTYVSATSFTVPGDVTSIYQPARRVWANMPIGGSIYGRVVSATFVTSTTVEVVWDSGSLLLETGILMSVGILSTVNSAVPLDWIAGQLGLQTPGILAFKDEQTYTDELVPIGSMRVWPSATPPATPGTWLVCDGSEQADVTYPVLAALLGNTFGPAAPGNFRLPDLRGRAVFGHDAGGAAGRLTGYREGINADTVGNAGGEEAHAQASDELVSHNHSQTGRVEGGGSVGNSNGILFSASAQVTAVERTGSTGAGAAMNVTPPGLILNWVIRAL